jgi:hypothetical protein
MFFLPELRKLILYVLISLSGKVFREKLPRKVLGFSICIMFYLAVHIFLTFRYCWQSYKYLPKKERIQEIRK